jgi:hypothetical protein
MQRLFGRLHSVGESFPGDRAILVGVGEIENSAILGRAPGRFTRVREEKHLCMLEGLVTRRTDAPVLAGRKVAADDCRARKLNSMGFDPRPGA